MQILLVLMGMIAFATVGFGVMILASPYSRRCWAVWLLTTATAQEEKRSAILAIEAEQKRRESEMRVSYGLDPIPPFQRESENKLAKRANA